MRLLYVVQRYGAGIGGGAEEHCRQFATRLASRRHSVEVLTSCAKSYVDWANEIPPFTEVHDDVVVRRLPVSHPRDPERFQQLNARVVGFPGAPLHLQEAWMHMQGPHLPGLAPWLERHGGEFDLVVFFTYLYFTTWQGLRAAKGRVPTVLHPTAHDEPPFHLPLFDAMLRLPSAFAFSTEEEMALVQRRGVRRTAEIIGVGVDLDVAADPSRFRRAFGLSDRPYLLYLGRLDRGKGAEELIEFFTTYRERRPRADLALVCVGDPVREFPAHPDVIITGYLADAMRDDALQGALALAQPSYFESFSMVLTEAWAAGVPALVQGRCDVLVGQVARSGGGIPYSGYAEFEVAVDLLVDDPRLGVDLGRRGRPYVERQYAWPLVMDRYEAFLERVAGTAVA